MNGIIIVIISKVIGMAAAYFFLQWGSSTPKEKIKAAAKQQEKTKDEYKDFLAKLDSDMPQETKKGLADELNKTGTSEEKKKFIQEAQSILQEVKTKEELDQKSYSLGDYGYATGVSFVVFGLVFWLIKGIVGSAKSNE